MASVSPADQAVEIPSIGHGGGKQQQQQQKTEAANFATNRSSAAAAAAAAAPAPPPAPASAANNPARGGGGSGGFASDGEREEKRKPGCVARMRVVDLFLRSASVAFLAVALSAMLTSSQSSSVQVLGLTIPVSMKWTRSQPFEFLVVVEILACAYSAIRFIYQSVVLAKKAAPTRKSTWIQLGADQAFVYLVLAAAAAAAGASRMNRAAFQSQLGLSNLHIPTVCSVLDRFCSRATIAIVFTLLTAFAGACSAALGVYTLSLC